ncbi:uncharacterized protein LOC108916842 [Anoplophora glabripennis]|uniref:uncharacterized protein LOC108916842 n=1 Tax=Anoplophora glabripennis TaxID=217634 RepID=UPI0008736EFD|nr:uncharacterized protein LOC108916842 [Anoplophora glabripennis]
MSSNYPNHKPNDRLKRAKSEISHNRISAETLRTEFRTQFFNRLRSTRSKSVDRFRQIVEDYGDTIKSISDVRRILLEDKVASSLLQSEQVNELLNLIEKELEQVHLNKETEEYVNTMQNETEDTVNRLLNICHGCGRICEDSICTSCATAFSTDFN